VFVEYLVKMATDTRTRILSVAARLFEADGFEGTAVASILREADVNSGSLYHFFASKDALLVAVLEKYVQTLESGLLDAAERAADDPIERIFALLELYRGRLLVSRFTRGCPVGDLALEVGSRIPGAAEPILRYFTQWSARVEAWLEEAGPGTSGMDRRAMAEFVLSVLQGSVIQARAVSSIAPFDRSVQQLRKLIPRPSVGDAVRDSSTSRTAAAGKDPGAVRRVGAAAGAGGAPRAKPPPGPAEAEADDSVAVGDAGWWRAW